MNNRGTSLVEILVASGILITLLVGITSVISSQNFEVRSLREKLAVADFQKLMIASLGDGAVCNFLADQSSLTFNSGAIGTSRPPLIDLGTVLRTGPSNTATPLAIVGSAASPLATSVVVSSISIGNFVPSPSDPNLFTAHFQVHFDPNRLARSLQPAMSSVLLRTTGGGTKTIDQCMPPGAANAGPGGPPVPVGSPCDNGYGIVMYDGFSRYGSPVCCRVGNSSFSYVNAGGDIVSGGSFTTLDCR